ncbi:MAG: hypothetical protein IJW06_03615 [Clostridia bacterium]|nr:hypothetical protein [Clostridia bacterium]
MSTLSGKDEVLFYQRLSELCERAVGRYCPEFTHFLDGRELSLAREFLKKQSGARIVCFGGFGGAERCVVGIFPEDIYSESPEDELCSMFDISGVVISGSGFSKFSHRDVLGSVLALGVKRETMGDIYVDQSENKAYICMSNVAASYVCDSLEFVSRDKVKCRLIEALSLPVPERKFSLISGTVASERLDCIISLVTKTSREKAKTMITSGLVSVNHVPEVRSDALLSVDDLLSVRGYGRFKIITLGDLTRKGRNRIVVHKMI